MIRYNNTLTMEKIEDLLQGVLKNISLKDYNSFKIGGPAKYFYLWWIHWEVWYKEMTWIMLEIVPPSEILKPHRAMEDFYNVLWHIIDAPNWREVWCEGELVNGPFWYSVEIASFEGEIHFYLRIVREHRAAFESQLHAHYPDAEILEVEDYTKKAPKNVPSKDYEMYGEDFVLAAPDPYPIKTYKYFEIKPEETEEERRVDPLLSLLESMAKLGKGEQLWLQMIVAPITNDDVPWVSQGKGIIEELTGRKVPQKSKSIVSEAFNLVVHDKMPFEQDKKEESIIPTEMKLTPGERETVYAVEQKIAKLGFRTCIRSIYITHRGAYFSPNGKIPRTYFVHFSTQDMNYIRFWGKTRPKIHYFFRKRRVYARKRAILRKYISRFPPLFPKRTGPGTMVLNAEELATIFHLPGKAALLPPGVPRTSARSGVPPASIPFDVE